MSKGLCETFAFLADGSCQYVFSVFPKLHKAFILRRKGLKQNKATTPTKHSTTCLSPFKLPMAPSQSGGSVSRPPRGPGSLPSASAVFLSTPVLPAVRLQRLVLGNVTAVGQEAQRPVLSSVLNLPGTESSHSGGLRVSLSLRPAPHLRRLTFSDGARSTLPRPICGPQTLAWPVTVSLFLLQQLISVVASYSRLSYRNVFSSKCNEKIKCTFKWLDVHFIHCVCFED